MHITLHTLAVLLGVAAGERCKIGRHEDRVIGGCTVAGWVCRGDWCQDSEGRAWEERK